MQMSARPAVATSRTPAAWWAIVPSAAAAAARTAATVSTANGTRAMAAAGPPRPRTRATIGETMTATMASTNARIASVPTRPVGTSSSGIIAEPRGAAGGARASAGAEDSCELVGRGRLQLVVAAVCGRLVRPPAAERRPVTEPVALEVVVGDLDHPFRPQRLPREVLAAVPAARRAGEPLPGRVGCAGRRPFGPLAPRVAL